MDQTITIFLLLLLPISPILYFLLTLTKRPQSPPQKLLPPSPPSLPILGHLHLLSLLPLHRSLSRLTSLHNNSPLLLLHLGPRPALLVSSFSAASLLLSKHDLAFSNRPRLPTTRRLSYNFSTLVAAPHGPHWRNLRRISSTSLFSPSKLAALSHVVDEEVAVMIEGAFGAYDGFRRVVVREGLDDMVMSVVMRMVVGRKGDGEERRRFRWVVREGFELAKEGGVGDFLPFLGWVIGGGRERRMVKLEKVADELFEKVVEEIRKGERGEGGEGGIVDCLLELQEKDGEYYTDEIIKGVILVLLVY